MLRSIPDLALQCTTFVLMPGATEVYESHGAVRLNDGFPSSLGYKYRCRCQII